MCRRRVGPGFTTLAIVCITVIGGAASQPAGFTRRCPPGGLLYNHVPKTGGTSMKRLLAAAAQTLGWPYIEPKTRRAQESAEHANKSQPLVVVQDDMRDFVLSAADAERYFTIGTSRPPCDYMLSHWSFRSDLLLREKLHQSRSWHSGPAARTLRNSSVGHLYGRSPPYTDAADLERLREWLRRAKGVSLQGHLRARYSDLMLERVHCWVVTSQLEAGVRRCLRAYAAACAAAESTHARASSLRAAAQFQRSAVHEQVSSASASCSMYFAPEDAKAILYRAAAHLDLARMGLSPHECCGLGATEQRRAVKRAYRDVLAKSLAVVQSSEAAEPDAAFREGFCRSVARGEGDCAAGRQGSWALSHTEAATVGAARACATRCRACARCRVYSYSTEWMDCSWFHDCDLGSLSNAVKGFRTREVARWRRQGADGTSRPGQKK